MEEPGLSTPKKSPFKEGTAVKRTQGKFGSLIVESVSNTASYPLNIEKVYLGRAPSCDIVIDNLEVSRKHARLVSVEGEDGAVGVYLTPLSKKKPVKLNGEELFYDGIGGFEVKHLDEIRIGDQVLRYVRTDIGTKYIDTPSRKTSVERKMKMTTPVKTPRKSLLSPQKTPQDSNRKRKSVSFATNPIIFELNKNESEIVSYPTITDEVLDEANKIVNEVKENTCVLMDTEDNCGSPLVSTPSKVVTPKKYNVDKKIVFESDDEEEITNNNYDTKEISTPSNDHKRKRITPMHFAFNTSTATPVKKMKIEDEDIDLNLLQTPTPTKQRVESEIISCVGEITYKKSPTEDTSALFERETTPKKTVTKMNSTINLNRNRNPKFEPKKTEKKTVTTPRKPIFSSYKRTTTPLRPTTPKSVSKTLKPTTPKSAPHSRLCCQQQQSLQQQDKENKANLNVHPSQKLSYARRIRKNCNTKSATTLNKP
ncbi:hypothetical protein ABK040_000039 [Willaertia magna]